MVPYTDTFEVLVGVAQNALTWYLGHTLLHFCNDFLQYVYMYVASRLMI